MKRLERAGGLSMGPEGFRASRTWGVIASLAFLGLVFFLGYVVRPAEYPWAWDSIKFELWLEGAPGPLSKAFGMTLLIAFFSLILSLLIGTVCGILRSAPDSGARAMVATYVEVIRGTPLLVQVFIWHFFIEPNTGLSPFWSGVLCLAVFEGAYMTEIVGAAIDSVHFGQWEAGRALGLSYLQTLTHVIMPQAARRALPALAGQASSLIKDSSLLCLMSLRELSKVTREIASNGPSLEAWFTVAALYFVLTFPLSMLARALERRLGTHDRG